MAGPGNIYDQFDSPAGQQGSIAIPADPNARARGNSAVTAAQLENILRMQRIADFNATHNKDGTPKDNIAPAPGDTTKTGDEYLKTLTPDMAAKVRMIAEGRMPWPNTAALRSPAVQQLLSAATQFDPTLDAASSVRRMATAKDFASGKSRQNITSLETVLGHMGELWNASQKLHNRSFTPWNSVANAAGSMMGDPAMKAYGLAQQATVDEMERAFRGASGSEKGIEAWKSALSSSSSPEQFRAAMEMGVKLLDSRLQSLQQAYHEGMGTEADPVKFMTPHAQAVFSALGPGGNGVIDSGNNAPPIVGIGGPNGPSGPAGPGGGGGPNPSPWNQDSGMGLKGSTGAIIAPAQRQEYDHEAAALMDGMVRSGMSGDQINQELAKRGMSAYSVNPADISNMQGYLKAHPDYKGSTVNPPLKTVDNTAWQRFTGGAPAAAAGGFANAASFGIPEALDPAGFSAWRGSDYTRGAEPLGEIGGAILATNKMGKYAAKAAEAYAPSILENTALKNALRQTATDTAYGAGRGEIVDSDPLGGAGAAALGSSLGQLGGAAIGRGLTGVTSSPIATRLRQAGITLTPGGIMRARATDNGGKSLVAGLEDMLANNPHISPNLNARRYDSLVQGNNAAFNTVSGGTPITGYGIDAADQLANAKNAAYSKAVDGVNMPVDPKFAEQFSNAAESGKAWDAARGRADYQTIMQQQLQPILKGGDSITGKQAQDAMRLLQSQSRLYKKAATGLSPDPAASGVSDALNSANDAFIGLTARQAPGAIAALKKANAINRGLSVLDDATLKGMNDGYVFTPAQLGKAMQKNTGALEGGGARKLAQSPLFQLQQDMQAVLPNKIPPTGVNNVAPYVTALLGAGGIASGQSTDNNALTAAGALALLASGAYSKTGTKALNAALMDRPDNVRQLGQMIRAKNGYFGSAAAAPFIEYMSGN